MDTDTKTKPIRLHFPDLWQILQIILLGVWVLFQYKQGNELYAIFMVLLFVILSISRLKNFTLIAASVLVLILFKTSILNTWIDIKESNIKTFQSFKPTMSKLFTPNSGKEVLPDVVQQMLSLLHENHIAEYRLSSLFEKDPLINQRIIESAWPVKKEETSKYFLRAIEEIESPTGCTEVDRRKDVILVHCP